MAIPSLLGSYIDQTYQRLVQTNDFRNEFADGLGNPIPFLTNNTATGSYGSFYDTGSYLATSATTAYSMSLNTTDISNGVIVSGSTNPFNTYIKFLNAGVYNVQFGTQFTNNGNSPSDIDIWLRKNGTDIPDTTGICTVPASHAGRDGSIITSWNYFITVAPNDYIQFMWHAPDANTIRLATVAAGTNPTNPRTPATIITAQRVDQFLSNTGSFSGSFTGRFTGSLQGTASYVSTLRAAGSNTQIQYNSASVLAASSDFTYDYTKKSVLIGPGHFSIAPYSLVVGSLNNVVGTGSVCIGTDTGTSLYSQYSFTQGQSSYANGSFSHAEGFLTNTYGDSSHAEGRVTFSFGNYSHAEGDTCYSRGESSHAEGYNTTASGSSSHAEGTGTTALGYASHAEGVLTNSSGSNSHAEGNSTTAIGDSSHAEGLTTITRGDSSHAEGINTQANANYSHTEGEGSIANGYGSHAEGNGTLTTNDYAHAEGDGTVAGGIGSHAEGESTYANGIRSHAEGFGTAANGDTSHAEGAGSTTFGQSSHAEGSGTVTNGDYSHAEGSTTTTYGDSSHSEGDGTATGQLGYNSTSIVAGNITLDSGYGNVKPYIDGLSGYVILDDRAHSNIYGYQLFKIASITAGAPTIINLVDTTVSTAQATIGVPGVVAPTDSDTIITGRRAHSEGSNTIASGWSSHAAGDNTNTVGDFSYAGGQGTIAYRPNQTAVGQYNKIFRENQTHYDSSFVVGKGTSTSLRDNIFEVLPTQNTVNIAASVVTIDGLTGDNTLPNIVSIDTGSKQLYTTSISSIRPKAGSVPSSSFSGGGPKTCSVSFTTHFPDNNYAITVTGTDGFAWSIIGKTSGSFGISSNSGGAITGPVYWIATPFNNS